MFDANQRGLHKAVCLLAVCLVAIPCRVFGQADLEGRVAKLEQSLSNRGLLDLLEEVERLKRDVATLRGESENQIHALDQLKKSHATSYGELEHRLQALQGGAPDPLAADAVGSAPLPILQAAPADAVAGAPASQGNLEVQTQGSPAPGTNSAEGVDAASTPASPAIDPITGLAVAAPPLAQDGGVPTLSPPAEAARDTAGSETSYQDAFALLKSGEYDNAIAAFEAFQQQYPDSQYGDNAQFWLAEAHYVKRDFAAALPAYQTMLSSYPASKKLSHAMLKIGYSLSELGQVAEARTVLTELQQRFPGSAAAQLAAQRLTQLPSNN